MRLHVVNSNQRNAELANASDGELGAYQYIRSVLVLWVNALISCNCNLQCVMQLPPGNNVLYVRIGKPVPVLRHHIVMNSLIGNKIRKYLAAAADSCRSFIARRFYCKYGCHKKKIRSFKTLPAGSRNRQTPRTAQIR